MSASAVFKCSASISLSLWNCSTLLSFTYSANGLMGIRKGKTEQGKCVCVCVHSFSSWCFELNSSVNLSHTALYLLILYLFGSEKPRVSTTVWSSLYEVDHFPKISSQLVPFSVIPLSPWWRNDWLGGVRVEGMKELHSLQQLWATPSGNS